MKKVYINQIEKMLNDNDLKGKELLRRFLWRNTIKPLFKQGDFVIFSETNRAIYGKRLINYVGKVEKIKYYYGTSLEEPFISYELSFYVNNETFTAYIQEKKLKKSKSKNNKHFVQSPNKYKDAFYI